MVFTVQYQEGEPGDIWYRSVSISYDLISGLGSCVFRQSSSSLYVLRSEAGCYKCAWIRCCKKKRVSVRDMTKWLDYLVC